MAGDPEAAAHAGAPLEEGAAAAGDVEGLHTRLREAAARLDRVRQERDEYRRQADHLRAILPVEAPAGAAPPVATPAPGEVLPPGKVLVDQEGYDRLRQAQRDLVRLLRRLGRPPLGWLLRRQKGYRRLRARWLREG